MRCTCKKGPQIRRSKNYYNTKKQRKTIQNTLQEGAKKYFIYGGYENTFCHQQKLF